MLIVVLLFHRETSLFFDENCSRPSTMILGQDVRGSYVLPLLVAAIRTIGGRGRFEYAAASIDVNESEKREACPRWAITLGGKARNRLPAHPALQKNGGRHRARFAAIAAFRRRLGFGDPLEPARSPQAQ
jgi:hypothetical protein